MEGAHNGRGCNKNVGVPTDRLEVQQKCHGNVNQGRNWETGLANAPEEVRNGWLQRYKQLLDVKQNAKLKAALVHHVFRRSNRQSVIEDVVVSSRFYPDGRSYQVPTGNDVFERQVDEGNDETNCAPVIADVVAEEDGTRM
jgi:hypothetical protein